MIELNLGGFYEESMEELRRALVANGFTQLGPEYYIRDLPNGTRASVSIDGHFVTVSKDRQFPVGQILSWLNRPLESIDQL